MVRCSATPKAVSGLVVALTLIVAGCGSSGGGGGGTSSTSALTVADTVSAVTAKSGSGTTGKPSAKAEGLGKPDAADKPNAKITTTKVGAYAGDPLSSYVRDDTREALNTPNAVLCLMAQTGYDQFVNKGNYIALVDTDSCFNKEGDHGSGSGTGESSGANEAVNLDTAVLNVSRPDNASPQTVKMWIDVKPGGSRSGVMVFGRMVVDAGKSSTNPWGLFTADFKGKLLSSDGSLGAVRMRGNFTVTAASSGVISLVYLESEGDVSKPLAQFAQGEDASLHKARGLLTIDAATGEATAGQVYAYNQFKGNFDNNQISKSTEANVAFNTANLLSSVVGGASTCYDRTKFSYNIWRYGLYDAAGSRVARNSGFPIRSANGTHAFLGYWGLWYPQEAAAQFADGKTVTKETYGGGTADSFTVVAGPGKLMKKTRQFLTLASLVSVTMEYGCYNPACGASLASRFQVQWNGSNLVKTAVAAQGQQGKQTWVPTSGTLTLPQDWNSFWTQALSGNATILSSSLSGLTSVIFHQEENVTNVQAANLTLYCTGGCLQANITQAQADAGCKFDGSGACQQDPRSLASIFYTGSPYIYLFSFGDRTLYTTTAAGAADQPVKTVAAVTAIGGTSPNKWGFRTRGMVLASAGMTSPWDSWNQDAVYEWETGPNQWNRYIGAKDSNGKLVSFDPPIRILYKHETANDVNGDATYNGATFQLEYIGVGQINGIPWVATTGDSNGWGKPAFGLRDGVVLNPGAATEYRVRALNLEQRMLTGTCTGLTIPALSAPVVTLVEVDTVIGARPTVTSAPAVIKGVLQ